MKPIIALVALVFAVVPASSFAQTAEVVETEAPTSASLELSAAYFGELATHPGLAMGAKFSLVDSRWYDLTLGPTLGLYVHPRNHVGLFLDAELENRFTAGFGLFGTVGVSAGYLHTWLGGDAVYVRDDDGGVRETTDLGRPHFKPGLSLGFGWDFEKNELLPLRAFLRLDAFGQMPFNQGMLPHAAVQLGVVYRFGGAP